MFRPTSTRIHLDRLCQNAKVLKLWAGAGAFFCPMVKAEAYGHGASAVAKALFTAGFSKLGVALVEEGVALRTSGFAGDILVFGPLDGEGKGALVEFNLTPVIHRWQDLQDLKRYGLKQVHLKFNTGMNRLGFAADEAEKLSQFVRAAELPLAGICTHLSQGSDAGESSGVSRQQLAAFAKVAQHFAGVTRHCLNSAGLQSLLHLSDGERAALGSRPGIALYGLPSGLEPLAKELQPVLELTTQIDVLQNVKKGQSVSYSSRWTAAQNSLIGIVPIGYADGYSRSLTNKGQMLCGGQRVNVVGTVCMDYTLLDLTNSNAKVGDPVVVIGRQGAEEITAVELAQKLDTVSYEIVTSISSRVPRIFTQIKAEA